ncbi:MAG: HlyD family secretion protein, partial [Phycisphaerae bacterium]|nr:HlyD family secretion protein [Phycisphaerae bacterium]
WQRAFVGAAGMYVELAVAAVAAIVWASTGENQLIHSIAYNLVFIASVSTLLFNANPLLRFDGYYILCDVLEIANLYNRSKQYLYYLVRRYVYGVRNVTSPAHTPGERFWMPIYAVCAFIYRIIVFTGILLYVSSLLFILGLFMAFSAFSVWVVKPLGSFGKYLFINPELERVRTRAITVTALTLATIVTLIGIIPFPDRDRGEGVVEPVQISLVHMETDGFIERTLPSGVAVDPDGPPLIEATNEQLLSDWRRLDADLRSVTIRRNLEQDPALKQALEDQIRALNTGMDRVDEQLEALEVHAPFAGVWVSPDAEHLADAYLERGERVGMVADLQDVIIRAAADQQLGPRILEQFSREGPSEVELRVRGRPDLYLKGTIAKVSPAGTQDIISPALGYLAGGSLRVDPQNPEQKTAEPFFEVRISNLRRPIELQAGEPLPEKLEPGHETTVVLNGGEKVIGRFVSERPDAIQINVAGRERSIYRTAISELSVKPSLLVGQRVAVRFTIGSRPLAVQWWRSIGQMLMRRFSLPSA